MYGRNPKIILSALLALLAMVLFFWLSGEKFLQTNKAKNAGLTAESLAIADANGDPDHDGLKNWEETLWKTDPNNPDTDGDKTPDGQEIKENRNPLKAGPDDKLTPPETSNINNNQLLDTNGAYSVNLTQQLSKNFNSGALQDLRSGKSGLSLGNLDASTQTALQNFKTTLTPSIPLNELLVSQDNSAQAIQKYIFEINKLMTTTIPPSMSEQNALLSITQSYNDALAVEYANYYARIADNLKQISVPSDFAATHQRGAEIFLGLSKTYEGLRSMKNDPLKALVAFQENMTLRDELVILLQNFAEQTKKYVQ
ncbi:MAG: hypothetical protein HZC14_01070 [Candidatus Niyogibacteria bacterium]|nr:hypothetical protein [Candidatus Niyogibacteria bacterium]